jgi:hypothetical protein
LRVAPSGNTGTIFVSASQSNVFGGRPLTSVAFPSQKVMYHDLFARHFGPRLPYCTHPESRLPLLMADSSAGTRSSADSNPGCNPNSGASMLQTYTPSSIDPPATGANSQPMPLSFMWTRKLLDGRDFGGPDVPGF